MPSFQPARAGASVILALAALSACVPVRPVYVVVTATNAPLAVLTATDAPEVPATQVALAAAPALIVPTPDAVLPGTAETSAREHLVRPGDTLSGIAGLHGVSVAALLEINALANPDILAVGQVVYLPGLPQDTTPLLKILPDSLLVRGPGAARFDTAAFIGGQPGYIRAAVDEVDGAVFSAAEIVERVSLEFGVDARLLLALLELRAGWLTDAAPSGVLQTHPLGAPASPFGFDRSGLYRQLTWAADRLNEGYYGWKYSGRVAVELESGERLRFAPGLNAATIGAQHMLSLYNAHDRWLREVGPDGLYAVYRTHFGDPFAAPLDILVPAGLAQPPLTLPFASGETWFFTGGPHGGWGSGSAWSAVDFAPPDDLALVDSSCYVSAYTVRAAAAGVVTRSADGVVVLDLDGDGDDATGWSVLYLHIDADGRVPAGAAVSAGDPIGRASCEGGVSNGTHVHIARRYNGEWIPADCSACPPERATPPFVLSGWTVYGLTGQEYQGYLARSSERRTAEQGRQAADNLISW